MTNVKVYGADWCPMTQRTLEHLDKLGVDYEYIDIEDDPMAREWVRQQNGGSEKKPTVDINGSIVAEPSNAELDELLAAAGRA